jgi:hypothetical protein
LVLPHYRFLPVHSKTATNPSIVFVSTRYSQGTHFFLSMLSFQITMGMVLLILILIYYTAL